MALTPSAPQSLPYHEWRRRLHQLATIHLGGVELIEQREHYPTITPEIFYRCGCSPTKAFFAIVPLLPIPEDVRVDICKMMSGPHSDPSRVETSLTEEQPHDFFRNSRTITIKIQIGEDDVPIDADTLAKMAASAAHNFAESHAQDIAAQAKAARKERRSKAVGKADRAFSQLLQNIEAEGETMRRQAMEIHSQIYTVGSDITALRRIAEDLETIALRVKNRISPPNATVSESDSQTQDACPAEEMKGRDGGR